MFIALTNQLTDAYELIPAGNVIPDGALSAASLRVLAAYGLIQQVDDDAAAKLAPPAPPNECEGCEK